jgi:2-oxo-4-hydroxy-4-carboxy-5-ureidoimidazoline decarboxylase
MEPWRRLDEGDESEARALLRTCCGSTRWVERMDRRRPFGDQASLLSSAREVWWSLGEDDWREAFAHHPKIGDRDALARRFATTAHLSAAEQRGVEGAGSDVLTALAEANRIYEERFGYIFIVCARGRTAEEMLALLRERLANDPAVEIRNAASEQAAITMLRLKALQ